MRCEMGEGVWEFLEIGEARLSLIGWRQNKIRRRKTNSDDPVHDSRIVLPTREDSITPLLLRFDQFQISQVGRRGVGSGRSTHVDDRFLESARLGEEVREPEARETLDRKVLLMPFRGECELAVWGPAWL